MFSLHSRYKRSLPCETPPSENFKKVKIIIELPQKGWYLENLAGVASLYNIKGETLRWRKAIT
jgi:hypothetical protein